jgi:tetratricopeptide (TPR) repeat protein
MNRRFIVILAAGLALPLAVGCAHNDNHDTKPDTSKAQIQSEPSGLTASAAKSQQQQRQQQKWQGADRTASGNNATAAADYNEPSISAATFFAAGQLAEARGNYKVAAEQYTKAAETDAGYLMAIYRLGVVYSRAKDWNNAVATWNRYIEETNGTASAYSNLGFCYELMGDGANAEEAYKKGLVRDPKNQPCRVNYGLMLARHSRYDEAQQQFAMVLTEAEGHFNIASIMEQQGRIKEAKTEYQIALKLDPFLSDAKNRLANVEQSDAFSQ